MRRMASILLALLTAVLVAGATGCKKGKAGSPCAKPGDCKYGFYCEAGKCKAGPETACGYVARCIPLLEAGEAETLFGAANSGFRRTLVQSSSEGACEAQLRVIAAMRRAVVLSRACGPRVTQAP